MGQSGGLEGGTVVTALLRDPRGWGELGAGAFQHGSFLPPEQQRLLHRRDRVHLPALPERAAAVDPRRHLPEVLLLHLRHGQQPSGLRHRCVSGPGARADPVPAPRASTCWSISFPAKPPLLRCLCWKLFFSKGHYKEIKVRKNKIKHVLFFFFFFLFPCVFSCSWYEEA